MGTAVERLADAIQHASRGAAFAFGVTPETLRVEGAEANRDETAIAEAAAMLHDRDLIHILFVGAVPQAALHRLLHVLTLDAAERRQRGGPAKIWAAEGAPSIVLDQIDYEQLLAREHTGERAAAGRDGLWRSIVLSIDHRIETLVAQCDPRVVPMLVRIIEESEPLGKDHEVVLETIEALGLVPSDVGVTALARIGTPAAQAVLADAAKTGDRLLRKIAAARR